MLFSKLLEFWGGAGRKKGSHTTRISVQLQHGYWFRANRIWVWSFSWFQVFEDSSKLLRSKTVRDVHWIVGVALQKSDTSCKMSRDDWRLISSCLPFLIKWHAIALAETAQWRGERRDLPVRLFNILHAFWQKFEKSIVWTALDYRSLRFLLSLRSWAVAAPLGSLPSGDCRNVR